MQKKSFNLVSKKKKKSLFSLFTLISSSILAFVYLNSKSLMRGKKKMWLRKGLKEKTNAGLQQHFKTQLNSSGDCQGLHCWPSTHFHSINMILKLFFIVFSTCHKLILVA